jgi:hypothetical protein
MPQNGQPQTALEKPGPNGQQTAPASFQSARQLWEFLGVGSSDFGDLADGQDWQEHEERLLQRVLYHLRMHFDWWDLERLARRGVSLEEVRRNLDLFRGEIIWLRGRAVAVDKVDLPASLADRLGFGHYFRVRLEVEGDPSSAHAEAATRGSAPVRFPVQVFSLEVPRAWQAQEKLDESAGAYVIMLKGGPEAGVWLFAASKRMAWFPNTPLGQLGMDVGLLDLLDQPLTPELIRHLAAPAGVARYRLGPHNRECFYQMLAAVGRAAPGRLRQQAEAELRAQGQERTSVVPLFNEPASQRGRLVLLSGTARDVLRVDVPDRDVRERFGIDHYYQVHLFTEDSQGNPLIICVRQLPPGMPVGSGPQYAEYVTVAGFFFNTWAYRRQPEESDPSGKPVWQLAPLVIARELTWHPREEPSAGLWVSVLAGVVFLVVLAAIWWGMIGSFRSRRPSFRASLPAESELPNLQEGKVGPGQGSRP